MRPQPAVSDAERVLIRVAGVIAAGLVALTLGACGGDDNRLQQVRSTGELVMVTRNSPTTYYEAADGPAGLEYDLAQAFARQLHVRLKVVVADRFSNILPMLQTHQADFAAAGLTVTQARQQLVRFTPPYQEIRQQVVYRQGTAAPRDTRGLVGRHIEIVAGTSYEERLGQLRLLYPGLRWKTVENVETEELLLQVQEGLVEITVADSNILTLARQFYPELQPAFDLQSPEALAWAFPLDEDGSLHQAASAFIEGLRASGELAHLLERYYGAATRFSPVNIMAYRQAISDTLPIYQAEFRAAARKFRLDWRLLAAVAYQESYWDPAAVSPTGVRGIMMLTQITAEHMQVKDREDPVQSIHGGARYLRYVMDRIPSRVVDPDRTWLALAAYNVGINHVEDARIITQRRGQDPDKWNDVRDSLPLLAKYAWYSRTRFGYARGYEPVQYVNRIRTYYDVLKKYDDDRNTSDKSDTLNLKAPAI